MNSLNRGVSGVSEREIPYSPQPIYIYTRRLIVLQMCGNSWLTGKAIQNNIQWRKKPFNVTPHSVYCVPSLDDCIVWLLPKPIVFIMLSEWLLPKPILCMGIILKGEVVE